MIKRFVVCLLIAAFALVESGAISRAQQTPQILLNHVRPAVSDGKVALVGHMDSTQRLHMAILLPLSNQAALDAFLPTLYDPTSPNYHQFLTPEQFADQFGPSQTDYEAVVNFARANGFTVGPEMPNRLLVDIDGTIAQVESAFHVSMNMYQHPTESRYFFSPDREPSLNLSVPVAHIAGLNNYSLPRPALSSAQNGGRQPSLVQGSGPSEAGVGTSYLPSDMRAAYYTTTAGETGLTGSGQIVAVAEFGGYSIENVVNTLDTAGTTYSPSGANYILTYPPSGAGNTIQINNIPLPAGQNTPTGPTSTEPGPGCTSNCLIDAEQVLDIAEAVAMAPGLSQVRVYIAPWVFVTPSGSSGLGCPVNSAPIQPCYPGSNNGVANDYDLFEAMATDTNRPYQMSLSWGWEPDSWSVNDAIFQEFIAQGQSFFVASGDTGAYPNTTGHYYPAEDPYVIAVGGTQLVTSGPNTNPPQQYSSEAVWNDLNDPWYSLVGLGEAASGGGYAQEQNPSINTPSWQTGAVNSSNQGSTAYRNVPDVAMEADNDNYVCAYFSTNTPVCDGYVGGTSLAAPRWAGFMALVNQQAVTLGDVTPSGSSQAQGIGFINYEIYPLAENAALGSILHDTISGGSNDLLGDSLGSSFTAVQGYNLVTGWGSPNGQALVNALTEVGTFTLSASPGSLSVTLGSNGSTTISSATSGGFDANVALSHGTLPSGVSVNFSTQTIAKPGSGSSTMTVTVASSTAPGTYTIAVTGIGGDLVKTVNVTLTVPPPTFTLSASNLAAVWLGSSTTLPITSTISGGFNAGVACSASNVPANVTITFSPSTIPAPGSGTCTANIVAAANAAAGTYTITVTGTGGGVNSSTTFTLYLGNFSISASPASLSVAPGGNGTSTITNTMTSGPEDTTVNLVASGQPTGVTIGFSPTYLNPYSGSTSTMTITVGSTTTPGTYTITVTGTANGTTISRTTTVTLTVGGKFTLSTPPPGFNTLMVGSSTTYAITGTVSGGFNAPVTCTASSVPTGVTINFSPSPIPAPGSGTCTANITAASTAPGGEYAITVTGTGGGVTSSTTFYLYVENISISASPAALSVSPGGSGTSTITLNMTPAPNDSTVTPVATGQPTGVTVSFNPTYLVPTSGTSTMTLVVASTTTPGTYPITVTTTWNGVSTTATVILNVAAKSPGSFTLSTPPPGFNTLMVGGSTTFAITSAVSGGFNAPVTCTASNVPTGVTITFSPSPIPAPGSGTCTANITALATALTGSHTITVTGVGGGDTSSTTFTLILESFSLTASPAALSVSRGSSGTSTIALNMTPAPNDSTVTPVATGQPAGVTVSFNPTYLAPTTGTSAMTVTVSSGTTPGTYPITVTATWNGVPETTTVTLTVL